MRLEKHLLELALAASVAAHLGAARVLPRVSTPKPASSAPVQFVTLPKPPPAAEAPAPEPEPEPEPPPPPKPTPRKAAQQPAPAPAEAPPPPAELSGKTLTAEGSGPSFEAPAGDGSSRSEPIQAGATPPPAPPPKPVAPAPAPRPAPPPPPATVKLEDLAKRPEPPALAGVLARHYPEDARRRGVGGQAVVRARVEPDGRVRTASVVSESEPGFGAACQRTLVGSKWTAPRGRDGSPVATWVRYTCRFRVGL